MVLSFQLIVHLTVLLSDSERLLLSIADSGDRAFLFRSEAPGWRRRHDGDQRNRREGHQHQPASPLQSRPDLRILVVQQRVVCPSSKVSRFEMAWAFLFVALYLCVRVCEFKSWRQTTFLTSGNGCGFGNADRVLWSL